MSEELDCTIECPCPVVDMDAPIEGYDGLTVGVAILLAFFVGLVLGEFAVGGLWSFARGVLGVNTYTFFI